MEKPGQLDVLKRCIDEAIQGLIAKEVDAAVKEAVERVESKVPELVAGVALRVFGTFDVTQMRDMIQIQVRLEDTRR